MDERERRERLETMLPEGSAVRRLYLDVPAVRAVVDIAVRDGWTRERMLEEALVRVAEERTLYRREAERLLAIAPPSSIVVTREAIEEMRAIVKP